jgi:hypothetical protein
MFPILTGCGKGDQNSATIASGTAVQSFSLVSTSKDPGLQGSSLNIKALIYTNDRISALSVPDANGWYSCDYAALLVGTPFEGKMTGTMKYRYMTVSGSVNYTDIGQSVAYSDVTAKEFEYTITTENGSFTAETTMSNPYTEIKTITGTMTGSINLFSGGVLDILGGTVDVDYTVDFNDIIIDSSTGGNVYSGTITATYSNNNSFTLTYNVDGTLDGSIKYSGEEKATMHINADGTSSYTINDVIHDII